LKTTVLENVQFDCTAVKLDATRRGPRK